MPVVIELRELDAEAYNDHTFNYAEGTSVVRKVERFSLKLPQTFGINSLTFRNNNNEVF